MNIFQLNQEHYEIISLLEEMEGEMTPELQERYDALLSAGEDKLKALYWVYKHMAGQLLIINEEKKRIDAMKKSQENKLERLKTTMDQFPLEKCGEPQMCAPAKEEERPIHPPEECKTSEKWLAEIPSEYKVKITDPDGWDRSNFEYSFKAECISKKEFIKRLQYSIVRCHVRFWASDFANN